MSSRTQLPSGGRRSPDAVLTSMFLQVRGFLEPRARLEESPHTHSWDTTKPLNLTAKTVVF